MLIRTAGPISAAAGTGRSAEDRKGEYNQKMRSDRYQEDTEELREEIFEAGSAEEGKGSRKRGSMKRKKAKSEDEQTEPDLSRLRKHELLEIMLAQSKEIDKLRDRVAELEASLANREFEFSRIGSIAEASLAVTNIFKEAEKAAVIYIENIRRRCEEKE